MPPIDFSLVFSPGVVVKSYFFKAINILQANPPYKTRQPNTNIIHAPVVIIIPHIYPLRFGQAPYFTDSAIDFPDRISSTEMITIPITTSQPPQTVAHNG